MTISCACLLQRCAYGEFSPKCRKKVEIKFIFRKGINRSISLANAIGEVLDLTLKETAPPSAYKQYLIHSPTCFTPGQIMPLLCAHYCDCNGIIFLRVCREAYGCMIAWYDEINETKPFFQLLEKQMFGTQKCVGRMAKSK